MSIEEENVLPVELTKREIKLIRELLEFHADDAGEHLDLIAYTSLNDKISERDITENYDAAA